MVKVHQGSCGGQHYTDAGDLGPALADFAQHLSGLGYTPLTVTGFHASARHFAQWLVVTNGAVSNINDAVIYRFARHRCRCSGGQPANNRGLPAFRSERETRSARCHGTADTEARPLPMLKPGRFRAPDKLLAMLATAGRKQHYAD